MNTSHDITDATQWRPKAETALLSELWDKRPKVVVKADLLPALTVVSLAGLLGVPAGFAWSRLAPATRVMVESDGVATLPQEDFHAFDAVAVFGLIGLVVGALIGVGAWMLRGRRGPVYVVAACLGAVAAGWLTTVVGPAFAGARYPMSGIPSQGTVVETVPTLGSPAAPGISWSTVLGWWPMAGLIGLWAFGAAVAYGLASAGNSKADLGRRLS